MHCSSETRAGPFLSPRADCAACGEAGGKIQSGLLARAGRLGRRVVELQSGLRGGVGRLDAPRI